MSEKRFTLHELVHYDEEQEKWVDCDRYCITDNETHINYDLKFNERQLCDLLNEQQSTIDKLEQRDYYNQSERYKILGRAIELTANYIANSDEEHYDFCALVTEFEKELLDNGR